MIKNIQIKGVASYSSEGAQLDGLAKINYIYGSNGSGKTTISRVIANPEKFTDCSIDLHESGREVLVYNRFFVRDHFNPDTKLKGIFTLGDGNGLVIANIDVAKQKEASLKEDKEKLDRSLSGKLLEQDKLENAFQAKCWELKRAYDEAFKEAFTGVLKSQQKFKERLIQESQDNKADLLTYEVLVEKAGAVFAKSLEKEGIYASIDATNIIGCENAPVLTKIIVGKKDVDIADMIEKLGNSDWVRQGVQFHKINNQHCPFCQKKTDEAFAQSLGEYFNETYQNDISSIKSLASNYDTYSAAFLAYVQGIVVAPSRFLDCKTLKQYGDALETKIKANKQHLERKIKEPSSVVILESLRDVESNVRSLVEGANKKASDHNSMVDNIEQEKKSLRAKVWRFIVDKASGDYNEYSDGLKSLTAAIEGIRRRLADKERELSENADQIRNLEKSITSIQPTIDSINRLLASFGFTGFTLDKAEKEGFYRIIRPDGSDAGDTLSEGEKSFITFLYFYHLLKGSNTSSGTVVDRIIVIDDPVSSLDSDVLFIVSNLITGLLQEVQNDLGHIKQMFILTHNVYFFKEITFRKKTKSRGRGALNCEAFWVVRKRNGHSTAIRHVENPIKSSYELLWDELRNSSYSPQTIQNTLRRIIENYFRIMGSFNDDDKIINMFSGKEKALCGSLLSWLNDGSHCLNDDLYMTCDESMVAAYLDVFRKIFIQAGHTAHYNMMMQITSDSDEVLCDAFDVVEGKAA